MSFYAEYNNMVEYTTDEHRHSGGVNLLLTIKHMLIFYNRTVSVKEIGKETKRYYRYKSSTYADM